MDKNEKIVARIRREDDGSLSNKRVEQFALLVAENLISEGVAWVVIMAGGDRRKAPSSGYLANVRKSPAYKQRVKELTEEREALTADPGDIWGQLEWQGRQLWRKGSALNDSGMMMKATDVLLKVAARKDPPPKPEKESSSRGPGAPPVDMPQTEDHVPNHRAAALLER